MTTTIVIQFLINLSLIWLSYRHTKHIESLKFDLGAVTIALGILETKLGFRDGAVVEAITGNLDAELEKSANMTEMRRAKRRALPRENAGPPAKIRKLKLNRK